MRLGVSYFGNRILRHLLKDLEDIKAHHMNYVVHTFSENDFVFYRRTMGEFVEATKEAGLEAWIDPWGVGKVFGGEAFSDFTGQNPDSVQIANDGVPTHCACPNAPKFRAFMREWIDAAVETGADVLFWDEPHFYLPTWLGGRPGTWACTCRHCRARWAEATGDEPFPTELTPELKAMRDKWLREFLAELIAYTHTKGRANAVCLLPITGMHEGAAANWEEIAQIPNISVLGTDPYWIFHESKHTIDNYVRPHAERIVDLSRRHGRRAQIWLQGFRIPAGREPELAQAVDAMVAAGVRDIAVWGFQACAHISWIRPDRPELVWETIGEAFARIKDLPDPE